MPDFRPDIPSLFVTDFKVDYAAPFRRHLNRLEVEIGGEDYRHLKRVELLDESPSEAQFSAMEEITSRLLETTQNNYNRDLLQRLGIRVYLDVPRYAVYYRLPDRSLRFTAAWRQKALVRFFREVPLDNTGWRPCGSAPPGFAGRFLPDRSGGVLLLRQNHRPDGEQPLITATHGPYDPHTLDVALYFLRTGKAGAALINLGFSGREPLTDANLEKLKRWGIPLNPSNIDVIYPYTDEAGHPYCYKLEEGLGRLVGLLEIDPPGLILDIHGCVGTRPEDVRLVVGLGGFPPFPRPGGSGGGKEGKRRGSPSLPTCAASRPFPAARPLGRDLRPILYSPPRLLSFFRPRRTAASGAGGRPPCRGPQPVAWGGADLSAPGGYPLAPWRQGQRPAAKGGP